MPAHSKQESPDDWAEKVVSNAIGVGRIAWGVTTALAPRRVHQALGVSYPGPDRGVWIKAFGIRDVVLGAGALHPDAVVRQATLRSGILMDAIDVAVVLNAARTGLPRRAAVLGIVLGGGTAVFAAAGPTLLRSLRRK